MKFTERLPLSAEESKLEMARYYDIEPPGIGVLEAQLLETACPIDPKYAVPGESFTDFAANITTYSKCEYGYCMLDEKRGYMANYLLWTKVKPEMTRWWYGWINRNPKDVSRDQGSLHYKLWYPGEHFDHGYINGKDRSGGVYGIDYDSAGNLIRTDRFQLDICDFGISPEYANQLREKSYMVDCAWETGEGGMHLSLNISKSLGNGIVEKRTRTWIGYGIKDGRIIKDENACCTEKMLYNMLYHQSVEGRYMESLVPELYAKYYEEE
jgi:hypothetical protein